MHSFLTGQFLTDLSRPLAHVTHIGAGAGADLPVWRAALRASGRHSITLIEGDPDLAEQLDARFGGQADVHVIQAVVSGDTSERTFRRMNFTDLNSLRAPTALNDLFPGLQTVSQETVRPVDPARLIGSLNLPEAEGDGGCALLVIEAPGEALGILQALAASDLLSRFEVIYLQEATTPLYELAPPAAEILTYLGEVGFVTGFENEPQDPEQPWLCARLNVDQKPVQSAKPEGVPGDDQAAQIKRLESALKEARTECEAAIEARNTAEKRLGQMRDEMLKAEGQIALIRDLLLHGPSL